ncbi:MAG TPA: SdiA-regulated domain-containing protein [Labilithrix sp.]|nr:SdiA-regulated domain-containing protein [Labilithrix sp.]
MRKGSTYASLAALVLAFVGCAPSDQGLGQESEDQRSGATLPLREVSGLAVKGQRFVAVGDRSSTVVTFRLAGGAPADVRAHAPLPKAGRKGSQYEAVSFDGAGNVVVLSERGELFTLSADLEREEASSQLDWDSASERLGARLDDNSLGEGLVVLEGGHVLVALEKNPSAIVEFGPSGEAATGYAPGSVSTNAVSLPPTLVALAAWKIEDRHAPDVSELTVGPDGALWALSQQAKTLVRFERVLRPDESRASVKEHVALPSQFEGAEGLAFDGSRPVVARDRSATSKSNLYVLDPIATERE